MYHLRLFKSFLFFVRDIKCENLLMDTNNNIKLSDFGFARNNMIKKNGQMKTSNTFCGSYAYASPEILKGIPYQPNASDIWSIGVVLYAMIFGTLPFDDTTYQKLLKVDTNSIYFIFLQYHIWYRSVFGAVVKSYC